MSPLVTILIPCYNGEKYLQRCLDSCVNQTYKNLKILIVNDGSTDESQNIIEKYLRQYANIKLINQDNAGISISRNVLIQNTTSEYGFFLDADDWIEADCIEKLINLTQPNTDLVIGSVFLYKKNKAKSFWMIKQNSKTTKRTFMIKNNLFAWNFLFKTNYLKAFPFYEKTRLFEDVGLMTYIIYKAQNVQFSKQPKYYYFHNPESACHGKWKIDKLNDYLNQLEYLYSWLEKEHFKKLPREINDQLAYYHAFLFLAIRPKHAGLSEAEKKQFKKRLKQLERDHFKLHFPRRYWKFWFYFCARFYGWRS